MRALLLILLSLSAAAGPAPDSRFDRFCTRADQGRSTRGFDCASQFALCDAVQAADKSGAWECMKGDGTMLAGSSTNFVATGVPVNTVENGWPVRTYTAAQNDREPANVAFPASDFTACIHHRSADLAATYELFMFGSGPITAAASSVLGAEQTITTGIIQSYTSNGAAVTGTGPSGAYAASVWHLICLSYQRVGGAANNVGTLYVDGVSIATSSVMNLAQANPGTWSTNGGQSASLGAPSSTRGFFVTYKLLTPADIARLYAAVGL